MSQRDDDSKYAEQTAMLKQHFDPVFTEPIPARMYLRQPADALPESGCRLERLELRHGMARSTLQTLRAAGLFESDPVEARDGPPGLAARISSPLGIVAFGE